MLVRLTIAISRPLKEDRRTLLLLKLFVFDRGDGHSPPPPSFLPPCCLNIDTVLSVVPPPPPPPPTHPHTHTRTEQRTDVPAAAGSGNEGVWKGEGNDKQIAPFRPTTPGCAV